MFRGRADEHFLKSSCGGVEVLRLNDVMDTKREELRPWVVEIQGINERPGFNFIALDPPKIDGGCQEVSSRAEPMLLQ